MKKIFFKAAALCCALSLSACASKKAVSVTPPDGSLDKCELRFSWWGGDDRHEATLKAIDLWSKKHPDITVTPEYGGWDGWTEKVAAQISGGTAPDIMQINYDWLISFAGENTFYDLDKLEDQLRRQKTRLNRRHRDSLAENFLTEAEEEEYDIPVKTKTIAAEKMDLEEAIMQMELSNHDFYIYTDDESGKISVVYRRSSEGYGLIEVEQED